MGLQALPSILDITDPTSNLAAYEEYLGGAVIGLVPSVLADNRFTWGADAVPALVAGSYGYRSSGSFLKAALYALAGYMAPLPAVGLLAIMSATPEPKRRTGFEGYGRKKSRSRRRRG